ncbi:hypothetical protein GOBAR_DD13851 [Gossypium barbadense]|nr:hypothetical protein GOBAR_DD13851 [Gossypium barbadense]
MAVNFADINDPPVFIPATPGEHNEPRNCGRGKPYKSCIPGTPSMDPPCSVYKRGRGCQDVPAITSYYELINIGFSRLSSTLPCI